MVRALAAAVVLLVASVAAAGPRADTASAGPAPAFTGAYLDSEANAYVGDGQQLTYTAALVQPSTWGGGSLSGNTARFTVGTFPDQFEIWFATPAASAHFAAGDYLDAERFGFSPDHPGLDVFGQGRGCDPLTGSFTVLEVTYAGDAITAFAARFEVQCAPVVSASRVLGGVWWAAHADYVTRSVSPDHLSFPTVHAGQVTPSQAFAVVNDGPTTLHISTVELTGADASDFVITAGSCAGATLLDNESCSVAVAFAPSDSPVGPPGEKTAELRFHDELGLGVGRAVALAGSSITWTVNTESLDFGDLAVGFRSAPLDLTITNDGPDPLVVNGLDLHGSDQWTVVTRPSCFVPAAIASGESCTASVVFVPTGLAGPRSATASFNDNSFSPYATVELTGHATARDWVVIPSTLEYLAAVSSPPVAKSITVTNNGAAPLAVADAVMAGSGASAFTVTPRPSCFSPGTIAVGASCTFPVTFTPGSTVTVSTATLSLVDALGNVYAVTSLTGAAVDPFGEYTGVTPARVFDTRTGVGQGGVPGNLPAGEVREVQIAGRGGLPASGVAAVVMNVTVTNPSSWGWVRVWPSDSPEPDVSNLNFVAGQTVANMVTVQVGSDGKVSLYSANGTVDVVFDVVGSYAASTGLPGSRFHGITPVRFLDTRVPGAPVGPGGSLTMTFTGQGGVPASGVTAVALNVTVTQPTSWGWLTVYPGDATKPLASSLNFVAGQTVANMVIVRVPANGTVTFFNQFGTTQVIADVMGYYDGDRLTDAGRFIPLTPHRSFDSRTDWGSPLAPDDGVILTWNDQYGQPLDWLGAIVANVTVTEPTSAGWITAFPLDATGIPWVSNLNFVPGQTVPNQVMVRSSQPGMGAVPAASVVFYNPYGYTHLIVDLFGFFTNAA